MRTTVTIRDDLYLEVRKFAAARGCTVGSVLEDAVTLLLVRQLEALDTTAATILELPTFSGGGLQPGVDLDSNASLSELLDEDAHLGVVRSRLRQIRRAPVA